MWNVNDRCFTKNQANAVSLLEQLFPDIGTDYEAYQPMLFVTLVNAEKAPDMPHRIVAEDLALLPFLKIQTEDISFSSPVPWDLLDLWGVSTDQLLDDSLLNSKKIMPTVVTKITDLLGIPDDDQDHASHPSILVISHPNIQNGAVCAFYPGILSDIAHQYQTKKLLLLPSSVHEILCLPATDFNPDEYTTMVREVNLTLEVGDWLSDHIYLYDLSSDSVSRIDA